MAKKQIYKKPQIYRNQILLWFRQKKPGIGHKVGQNEPSKLGSTLFSNHGQKA